MNKGKIVQIIGPVVDIEFPDKLPAIYNALTIEFTSPGAAGKTKLTLEVQQHLGDNWVRAVAMSATRPPHHLNAFFTIASNCGDISPMLSS